MDTDQQALDKPRAVCLIRLDTSGLETPRHATLAQRHAAELGYVCLYTVRPPVDHPDPIGYALGIAAGLAADALIVYDLTTVDNMPSRVCELLDLQTVCPPTTWTATLPATINCGHAHPDRPLTIPQARRIMQQLIVCRAFECPLKASAYSCLVRAGKIVPPVDTLRERAAARGIPFEPLPSDTPQPPGPTMQTLLDVLEGLALPDADPRRLAARLSPGVEV
ncbi:hypothetical protein [Nocardia altamirensis]|uniref:hypothetical protein n=1 Tax=Nocardia altamirensis TaxID=472158 RepID=UPI00083FF9FC|nr:hypothetical protein [Nocardia altamirensis]